MKITVVGGGPAGLYFASLMKAQDPAHEIRVLERNPRDATFGWGVVFSGKTLSTLAAADPVSHARLSRELMLWEEVHVAQQGRWEVIRGNSFSGVSRLALLRVLQERCEELGVEVLYSHPVEDVSHLEGDLIVAADGVGSVVREHYREHFQPELREAGNRYIWLGTRRLFPALTLLFRGDYAAHAYQFSPELSTFIVETASSGEADLARVFAEDLQGHELLSNNSRWIRFLRVSNREWYHPRVVLLGDALHTAHFSIGSGTKLAMEDSIALANLYREDAGTALQRFATERRPAVERYQAVADESQAWFEACAEYADLSPLELAYQCMTRSKVDVDNLRLRDPAFVARWEAAAEAQPESQR